MSHDGILCTNIAGGRASPAEVPFPLLTTGLHLGPTWSDVVSDSVRHGWRAAGATCTTCAGLPVLSGLRLGAKQRRFEIPLPHRDDTLLGRGRSDGHKRRPIKTFGSGRTSHRARQPLQNRSASGDGWAYVTDADIWDGGIRWLSCFASFSMVPRRVWLNWLASTSLPAAV